VRLPALSAFGPSADAASDDDNDSSDGAMDMSNDTGSALPTIVDGAGTPLKLGPVPVAVSFALLEGTVDGKPAVHVLSDPSIEEEAAMQSSVTVCQLNFSAVVEKI
jgi:exosome complex RNA-binding protein Rrp42 (RNase PH superfamily)